MIERVRPMFFAAAAVAAVLMAPRAALAGPPLLCFPFDIGNARSLPMLQGSWRAIDPGYDVSHLVGDTLALLMSDTPVIVRMETLRRATVYAADRPEIAEALLSVRVEGPRAPVGCVNGLRGES